MQDKIKEENGGWLIPDFVKNKRIKHLQEQLDKLKRSEASENYVLQDLINNHDSIVKEYNNKISLLHGPRRATIQKITIKAYGNWDPDSAADLAIKYEGNTIVTGDQDSNTLSACINVPIGWGKRLIVYDRDVFFDDQMGIIPLELNKLPYGVSGDSFIRKLDGDVSETPGLGFRYNIEYEVEY